MKRILSIIISSIFMLVIMLSPILVRKPDPNCHQTKKFECVSWCLSLNCGQARKK